MQIIDVHTHCGYQFFPMRCDNASHVLTVMDRFGIDLTVLSSIEAIFYDFRGANERIEQVLLACPERLYGYIVVNPNYPHESQELIGRYAEHPQFLGVKMHPSWHNKAIDGTAFAPLFASCEKHGLPVLIHSYVVDDAADQVSSPERILRVAKRHANPLIIAHMGGNHHRMIRAMLDEGNPAHVFTDISTGRERASQLYAWSVRRVEDAVQALGAEKILFGTDFPPLDPSISFGMMRDAQLSVDEQEAIYWRNARRIFKFPVKKSCGTE